MSYIWVILENANFYIAVTVKMNFKVIVLFYEKISSVLKITSGVGLGSSMGLKLNYVIEFLFYRACLCSL